MALRKGIKLANPRRHRRRSKWPYIVALVLILGTSFYLFGYLKDDQTSDAQSTTEKAIDFLKGEPEPEPVVKKDTSEIITTLESYLVQQKGTYGYTVIELDDGRQFGKRDSTYYTAASSIKVAIFTYLYHQIEAGKINPNTKVTYLSSDYETGTGSLQSTPIGSKYQISYLAERMIVVSDNVATNMLVRTLGRTNIQNYLNSVGLAEVKMVTNDVTPRGMAKLLKLIYNGELLDANSKELLISYMKKSITPERLVAGVPSGVEVAHKIGSWSGAMSDIGIVFADNRAYAIAVYSDGVAWGATTDAVIAGISKRVYDFEASF